MCLQHLDLCKHLWGGEGEDGGPTGQLTVWPVVRLFDQAWLDSIALPGRPLKRTILNRKIKTQNKFNVLFVPTSLCLCVCVCLPPPVVEAVWDAGRDAGGSWLWLRLGLCATRHPIVHDGRKLQYAVEKPEVLSIEYLWIIQAKKKKKQETMRAHPDKTSSNRTFESLSLFKLPSRKLIMKQGNEVPTLCAPASRVAILNGGRGRDGEREFKICASKML